TAAGQRNRNFAEGKVRLNDVPFSMEELLFDPQTSGGLLIGIEKDKADELLAKLKRVCTYAAIVGEVTDKKDFEVEVIK
ncbi:MAG: selenide, water dikinase SelD, partial [Lachnospiraceae bacterium]|nr:selenide, water dikinase SelD [Lachnospiraceae bacterium]